jgi:hypothetical protein
MLKPYRDGVRERKNTLKLHSPTPSLLQDCASLPALLALTAESGFNPLKSSNLLIPSLAVQPHAHLGAVLGHRALAAHGRDRAAEMLAEAH